MMAIVVTLLAIAFLGSIAATLIGVHRSRDGMTLAGVAGLVFFALQLGGALETMIS